jgi:hypothetical protein
MDFEGRETINTYVNKIWTLKAETINTYVNKIWTLKAERPSTHESSYFVDICVDGLSAFKGHILLTYVLMVSLPSKVIFC